MTAFKRWKSEKQYRAKLNLLAHIHREVDPLLEKDREAWSQLGNGVTPYLENSPETYGQRFSIDPLRFHANGISADCELSETDQVIVKATGHDHEETNMEKEAA